MLPAEADPPPEAIPPPVGTSSEAKSDSAGPTNLQPPGGESSITLHTDDLDVRKTLEMLSRQAKVGMVVSPGVTGKITMDIQNKTLDEALGIISKLCRLAVRREADVVYISTPLEVRQAEEDNLPVRIYHLNYTKSSDVMKMVTTLKSAKGKMTSSPDAQVGLSSGGSSGGGSSGGGSSGGGGGSSGGGGGAGGGGGGTGGNSLAGGDILIVQDYEDVLKKMDRVIAELDVQPPQVLIEAVILQVQLTKALDLGASFAVLDDAAKTVGTVGSGAALNAATGFSPATVVTSAGKLVPGFASDTSGIKFGFVGQNGTAFVRALESRGETRVLAAPRLLVLNKQSAEVQLGAQLGFQNQTTTQTSTSQSFQQIPIGTVLDIRPFVSSDGMIRMEIHPQRATGKIDAKGIPQTNTAQVQTNVLVPDGTTLVIGGLIDDEVNKDWDGIPFLSRIPWLGYLFRTTADKTQKMELVVVITPHIYRPQSPEATNYLGYPRTLGLAGRLTQRPHAECADGPSLFELPRPEPCPGQRPPFMKDVPRNQP
jgi:general secretion pathway protein D